MEIKELSEEIHSNQGKDGYGMGRNYITPYLNTLSNLSKTDKIQFIAYNLSKINSANYNMSLLNSCPEIWEEFTYSDWITILGTDRKNPNDEYLRGVEKWDLYVGIWFLVKNIEINAIEMFIKIPDVSLERKKKALTFFRKQAVIFIRREGELEKDADFFGELTFLKRAKQKLLDEGKVKELPQNKEKIENLIDSYYEQLFPGETILPKKKITFQKEAPKKQESFITKLIKLF